MCMYLNISCDMLEYTHIPAQPHKRRQNSNLKENFHPRIENSSKKWSMTFFSPKLSFFLRISYLYLLPSNDVKIRGHINLHFTFLYAKKKLAIYTTRINSSRTSLYELSSTQSTGQRILFKIEKSNFRNKKIYVCAVLII